VDKASRCDSRDDGLLAEEVQSFVWARRRRGSARGGPEGACLRQSLGLGAGQHQIWDLAFPVGKTDRFERFHS